MVPLPDLANLLKDTAGEKDPVVPSQNTKEGGCKMVSFYNVDEKSAPR